MWSALGICEVEHNGPLGTISGRVPSGCLDPLQDSIRVPQPAPVLHECAAAKNAGVDAACMHPLPSVMTLNLKISGRKCW